MAEKSTFIKLDRNIKNWRWYQDANTFRVFIHLLLTANIKRHDFEMDVIERGQLATSIGKLASTLKISYQQARTALNHLQATNEITIKRRPKYLVISIVNYDAYQSANKQITNDQQTNNKQVTNDQQQLKNDKNEKKEKNNITSIKMAANLEDYGGIFLSASQWDELEKTVGPAAMHEYVDRVARWLDENPRQKRSHINVLKKFLRNDGLLT